MTGPDLIYTSIKTFSKSVKGCRDGSVEHHRKQVLGLHCASEIRRTKTVQGNPIPISYNYTYHPSGYALRLLGVRCRDRVTYVVLLFSVLLA